MVGACPPGRYFSTENPYSRSPWARLADGGTQDVDAAVDAARRAFDTSWSHLSGASRGRILHALADRILDHTEDLALAETRDNGKLLREMRVQIGYIADWFRYYAGLADKLHGDYLPTDKDNFFAYTRPEPIGVVAAITPWNSPLLLLTWKLAPALAAGCTAVVKPSEHAPTATSMLADVAELAGLPAGVLNVITADGPAVAQYLAGHPGVNKVAFTGSTATGSAVARATAGNITRLTLELGGKSAQIVFDDADIEAACNGVLAGIFAAGGQTCMAGSRLLVQRSIHDRLVDLICRRAEQMRLGDPTDPATEMGPMANAAQFTKTIAMIDRAREAGCQVATGGGVSSTAGGYFVQPTVLTHVPPDAEIAREEVFGPVLTVFPFDTEDEAIALSNDSLYGLAGAVWTSNSQRGHRVAHQMHTGTVWINGYRSVSPQAPFGGIGRSGLGRENGADALYDYTETKTVWVELDGATRDPFVLG